MAQFSTAHRSNSARVIAIRVVLMALVFGAGYLVFEFGRIQGGYDVGAAGEDRQALVAEIDGLESDIVTLKEQIALLETHRDIDREAYSDVEGSLTKLQAKIQEQQDAIAFYRGIVSPADGKSGLRVQDFRLSRGNTEREYQIRLVLVQAKKHDRKVSGRVVLNIVGIENGEEKSYGYTDLLPEGGQRSWEFSFRYFQDFDRQVVLPDGFKPERVSVQVESRTRSISSIEESFAWMSGQG